MPGAPSGLVTIERVSQGKPWAKLCWPVGPKTWLYLSIFPPENARPNSEHPPRGNKTSKIHLNLAPFGTDHDFDRLATGCGISFNVDIKNQSVAASWVTSDMLTILGLGWCAG